MQDLSKALSMDVSIGWPGSTSWLITDESGGPLGSCSSNSMHASSKASCSCRKFSMLFLGDCSELTEVRSLKTADAAREVDGISFEDDCIPVYSKLCLTS